MRKLLAALLAFTALSATAQQVVPSSVVAPPAGSNWQHVQVLPVGTSINVKARSSHASCKVKRVDADSLTCTDKKDIAFQRTDVVSIKISRRGRSTLIGLAAGAGGAGAIGAAATKSDSFGGKPGAALVYGLLGGLGGMTIGYFTDFSRSTVYQAP